MALDLAKALFSWIIILPALFLAGTWVRPLSRVQDVVLRGVLYCATGMAVLSYGIVFLGELRWLTGRAIWFFLGILLVTRANRIGDWTRWIAGVIQDLVGGGSRASRLLGLVWVVSFVALLMGALAPETGNDALCYQLNLPKVFLAKGSTAPEFEDLNSYFPMFLNHLYLAGLATGGVSAAKLFHFFCGFLLFLTVKRLTARETQDETIAFFIALAVWLTPVGYQILSTAYVDAGVALYTFLALWVLSMALELEDRGLLVLGGFLIGCAVAIKYLALVSVLALAVGLWLWAGRSKRASSFVLWTAGVGLGCGYWLLRNWMMTRNPVFPYLANLFGTEPIPGWRRHSFEAGRSVLIYFLLMPFVVCAALRVRRSRPYVLFSILFLAFLAAIASPIGRYLLPVFPAVGVAAAHGIHWFYSRITFKTGLFLGGVGVGLLGVYLAAGVFHYRHVYRLFLGHWSPQEYLEKMERTAPAAEWVNQNLPQASKILMAGETRQFYFNRPLVRDEFLRYRTHYDRSMTDVPSLGELLKSRGITHLLWAERVGARPNRGDRGVLEKLVASRWVTHLESFRSRNIRNGLYQYQLYQLN